MENPPPSSSDTPNLRTTTLPPASILHTLARAYCFIDKEHMHKHARTNAAAIIAFTGAVWGREAWREELALARKYDVEPGADGYWGEGMRLFRYAVEQLRETDVELASVLGEARMLGTNLI